MTRHESTPAAATFALGSCVSVRSELPRWLRVKKFDRRAVAIVDGFGPYGNGIPHYSRRKPGSPQFMPPGQTIVLMTGDCSAVWGWWRPHPASGLVAMNKRDGWTCTLFRNDRPEQRSSALILAAEAALADHTADLAPCGPDGMLTYVFASRVRSLNPGYCYRIAGWSRIGTSADRRKLLFQKPFALAGIMARAA